MNASCRGNQELELARAVPRSADVGGYAALFFRPEILAAPELPAGDLLGVMAHLELAADADAAMACFEERRDAGAIRAAMGETAEELLDTRELEPEVAEADDAVLFRVEYAPPTPGSSRCRPQACRQNASARNTSEFLHR